MTNLLAILLTISTTGNTSKAAFIDTTGMRALITKEFTKQPKGTFAVAMKDLSTGQTFFINERETYHAASTMKTPVMIEVYKQAKAGRFKVTDSVLVKSTFKSILDQSEYTMDSLNDSETDLYKQVGKKLPISDLLFRMITKSSNLATNNMIELVGAKNVTQTMRSFGAKNIEILRGVEDTKAFEKGMNNTTNAYDLTLIFERIAKGTAVDKKATDAMLDILFHQHYKDKIAGKLPPEVRVASKSGSIGTPPIMHDSGIVFLPDGRKYVVVLLSRNVEDLAASANTLADVSKIIYDHMITATKK
jgi:beta-lactamase class A